MQIVSKSNQLITGVRSACTRFENHILVVLYTLAVSLVLFQYLIVNRSLWLDEVLLAENFTNGSFADLLKPLRNGQIAPIGYLLTVKSVASIFGYSEWTLRLPSVLASCLTIYCLWFFIRSKLSNHLLYHVVGLALLSFSEYFVYYSSEVKQYSFDLLFTAMIFTWVLNIDFKTISKKEIGVGIAIGMIGSLFSNVIFIPLFAGTCIMCIKACSSQKKKDNLQVSLLISLIWLTTFCTVYFMFFHNHPRAEYMKNYWGQHDAFPNFGLKDFSRAFNNSIYASYSVLGEIHKKYVLLPYLYITSLIVLIYKKHWESLAISLCILLHLIIASLKLYPFHPRLTLYLHIPFIWSILMALHYIGKHKIIKAVFIVTTCLCLLPGLNHFAQPIKRTEIRESMEYVLNKSDQTTPILALDTGASSKVLAFYMDFKNNKSKQVIMDWDMLDRPRNGETEVWYFLTCWSPEYYGHPPILDRLNANIIERKEFGGMLLLHVGFKPIN